MKVLYPADYLDALAKTESLRARFVTSGADTDYESYATALAMAIDLGKRDAAALSLVMHEHFATTTASMVSPAGALGVQTMLDLVDGERSYMDSLAPGPNRFVRNSGMVDIRFFR